MNAPSVALFMLGKLALASAFFMVSVSFGIWIGRFNPFGRELSDVS